MDERAEAVRRFNRFYTRQIGVLRKGYLRSPFSLTEVRVLYELAQRDRVTASELASELDLDPGYLSRILARFGNRGFVKRSISRADARQSNLRLSKRGHDAFAPLNEGAQAEVAAMLGALPDSAQRRLLAAMQTIESLLRPGAASPEYTLRQHRPGDIGWVVHRHGALYAQEYGWDKQFEALVAGIVAHFIEHFDEKRDRCWIAERDGSIVGSVFLVKHTDEVAKLRLLFVEPSARGLGIGHRLVDECVRFARQTGYRTITLWTQSNLEAARRIYKQAGFRLVHEEPHVAFGFNLVSETWDLDL